MEVVCGQRWMCLRFTAVLQYDCIFQIHLSSLVRSATLKGSQNFGIREQIYFSNKQNKKKKQDLSFPEIFQETNCRWLFFFHRPTKISAEM